MIESGTILVSAAFLVFVFVVGLLNTRPAHAPITVRNRKNEVMSQGIN
jgi:hypothetical protein